MRRWLCSWMWAAMTTSASKPSIWLGPVALRGQAAVINDSQYDLDVSSKTSFYPNKSRSLFDKVIDTPRLTGNIWYAFANPNDEPVIEVGFLNGQQSRTPRCSRASG